MAGKNEKDERTVAIVGGGIAGLTAAAALARGGAQVVVLERAKALGGRARTDDHDGFLWNLGPHALYRDAEAGLRQVGVEVAGVRPPTSAALWTHGDFTPLPASPAALLRTPLLSWRGRAQVVRFLSRAVTTSPAPFARTSMAALLTRWLPDDEARALARTLVRLATYTEDLESLSAEAGLAQMKLALRGVRYVDGGWGAIVDALARRALEAGAELRGGCAARAIERDGAGWRIVVKDGPPVRVDDVVVALPAQEAARLLPDEASAARAFAGEARPLRAACLDLALSSEDAHSARPFVLGVEEPWYLADHSRIARLAPEGGVVLHAARYLHDDEEVTRASLEGFLDVARPGWRRALVHARFLPRIVVQSAKVTAGAGGFAGRPSARAGQGLYLAGDWVGPRGLLASASVLSALDAARALLEDRAVHGRSLRKAA